MEEIKSQKNGTLLKFNNYVYRTKGSHKDTKYWKCVREECPGILHVKGGVPLLRKEHNHEDDYILANNKKFKADLKEAVSHL